MKKIILLSFAVFCALATSLIAQNYVEIPAPGGQQLDTKAIIDADSLNPPDGYLLERGAVYWFNGTVIHDYPIKLIGKEEPADVTPPVLMAKTDLQGIGPNHFFESSGDLHLENLYIVGLDELENASNFAYVVAPVRVTVDNCYFTMGSDWEGFFRLWSKDITFIMHRSVCFNVQREDGYDWTRLMFGLPGDNLDTLILQHNTFWGMAGELYGVKGEPDYLLIDHNTFVSEGQQSTTMQLYRNATYSNNIYHNVQIHGDAIGNARGFNRARNSGQLDLPLSNFMVDTLGTNLTQSQLDSILAVAGVPYQTLNIHNNNFFINEEITSWLDSQEDTLVMVPPMAGPRTLDMAAKDEEFPGINYDLATNWEVDPGFTNDPSSTEDMIAWVNYQMFADAPSANFLWPNDGNNFTFEWPIQDFADFTYSNTALVSDKGYHMGDLYHWYPDEYEQWLLTDVEEVYTDFIPTEYRLEQNYPNPFNPTTSIQFSIPENAFISLKVYDVLGQEIASLVDQELKAGVHKVDFDAQSFTSGIYFYTIESRDFIKTNKMILLK